VQVRLQLAALPVEPSIVHAFPSLHELGQLAGGSQVSPASIVPLPQVVEQSLSVLTLQPAGQQPSPLVQVAITTWSHAGQPPTLPVAVSSVHALLSSHVVGHPPGVI
jgi:hypothetical protein